MQIGIDKTKHNNYFPKKTIHEHETENRSIKTYNLTMYKSRLSERYIYRARSQKQTTSKSYFQSNRQFPPETENYIVT